MKHDIVLKNANINEFGEVIFEVNTRVQSILKGGKRSTKLYF